MHIDRIKATRGVRVKVGGNVHTAEFTVSMAEVGDQTDLAEKRATELAEKATSNWLSSIYGGRPNGTTTPKSGQQSKMVELIFDSTNSKERSDRIMRAMSEEMVFEEDPDSDGWICTDHNGRQFHVNADREKGLGICDCEDFIHRGMKSKMPCKHIYALVVGDGEFWEESGQSGK